MQKFKKNLDEALKFQLEEFKPMLTNAFNYGIELTENEYKEKLSKLNFNDNITIFPNKKGFEKIKSLISNKYLLSAEESEEWVKNRTTKENGYKDQMWVIINDLHDMFFNGQNFLENSYFSFL